MSFTLLSSPSLLFLRNCSTTSSYVKSVLRVRTISFTTRLKKSIDSYNNKHKAYPSYLSFISERSILQQQQQQLSCSISIRSNLAIQNQCCQNVVRSSSSSSAASTTDDAMTNINNNQAPTNTNTSTDGVIGIPIDFDIAATIEGNESQIVIIQLRKGQVLRAESGAMMYMTDGIQMNTTTGGTVSTGFSRMLTGQNFFISDYTYDGNNDEYGILALGTDFPSKIIRLNVSDYTKLICQKGALLCASHTIDIQMEFSKNITTGSFGGEGFILQVTYHLFLFCMSNIVSLNLFLYTRFCRRYTHTPFFADDIFIYTLLFVIIVVVVQGLTGNGEVFLKAGGTIIKRELQDQEQLRISSGCLVAFTSGVDYGTFIEKE